MKEVAKVIQILIVKASFANKDPLLVNYLINHLLELYFESHFTEVKQNLCLTFNHRVTNLFAIISFIPL